MLKTHVADMEVEAVSSEPSAVVIASIDDLLTEILVRLPLRSFIRFKLVSKHWNSLVSDTFCQMPYSADGLIFQGPFRRVSAGFPPPYTPLVVTFDKSSTTHNVTTKDLSTGIWRRNVKALNSCNGLLICAPNNCPQRSYYVCNPVTGKSSHHHLNNDHRLAGICLAFDPANSTHYSVVCVYSLTKVSMAHETLHLFEVFSSETGGIKTGEPFMARADFNRGVYWNGSLHWICSSENSVYINPNEDENEEISPKFMPTPPLRQYDLSFRPRHYFGESGGHLNFIENAYKCSEECVVHEMRDDYSEWFVKFRVDLSTITMDRCSVRALVRRDQGVLHRDSFLVILIGRELVVYNLVCNTFQTVLQFEDKDCYESLLRQDFPLQYIESLAFV